MIRLSVFYPVTEGASFGLAEVANYTPIAPVLQTSEIVA
jgi:hypothetical protein